MRSFWRQLRALLGTPKSRGTLLVAVAGSIALGVVPNILESWTTHIWLMYVAFVVAVAGVLLGWSATRDRGLGILLKAYPNSRSEARAAVMGNAARSHSTLLELDRKKLWPGDEAIAMTPEQIRLLCRLIDAPYAEHITREGGLEHTRIYPLMTLHDGYCLGQALQSTGAKQSFAHCSHATSDVVLGIRLLGNLRATPTPEMRALAADCLMAAADPFVIPNPEVLPDHPGYRRLALIVRLTKGTGMVRDARYVAETGNPLRGDGTPTGYFFNPNDPTAKATACGAVAIIEVKDDLIPEDPAYFSAITAHICAQWIVARTTWSATTGARTEGLLFLNGPLPIAIALGWALNDDPPTIVGHEKK